jgi:ABC-type transport system substrate-binding protein
MKYKNPNVDELLTALDSMKEDNDRFSLKQKLSNILISDKPVAFLFQPYDTGLFRAESGRDVASSTIWEDLLHWDTVSIGVDFTDCK